MEDGMKEFIAYSRKLLEEGKHDEALTMVDELIEA